MPTSQLRSAAGVFEVASSICISLCLAVEVWPSTNAVRELATKLKSRMAHVPQEKVFVCVDLKKCVRHILLLDGRFGLFVCVQVSADLLPRVRGCALGSDK